MVLRMQSFSKGFMIGVSSFYKEKLRIVGKNIKINVLHSILKEEIPFLYCNYFKRVKLHQIPYTSNITTVFLEK